MGEPIVPPPDTFPRGVPCGICDGVHWPANSTPSAVYATTFGVMACPGYSDWELNHTWILGQVDGFPCSFIGHDAFGTATWEHTPHIIPPNVLTTFGAGEPGGDSICDGVEDDCAFGGGSLQLFCAPGVAGHHGGLSINTYSWPSFMACNYNFVPADDTLYDTFSIPDGDAVVRFASPKYSINVKIKVHIPDLPTDQEGIF